MSLNPFLPAPVTPPVTDSFTLGTVTQVSPLRVQRDGDTGPTDATPINTAGPLVVGDRVWCQLHGRALLVVSSVNAPARDLWIANYRSLLGGGGVRSGTSTGVTWSQRFIMTGAGRGAIAGGGYFNIERPADGTVIPVYGSGSQTTATVSGVVPLSSWQTLWYELPVGSASANSVPENFRITYFGTDFDVPPTWVPVVTRNADTSAPTYVWADGRETSAWTNPTPSSPWSNYGSGYAPLAYKRENGIVYLQGLIKGATTTSTGTIFTLPVGYRPAGGNLILINHSSGGVSDLRVFTSGVVSVYAFISGNASDVSLNGISFPADQ